MRHHLLLNPFYCFLFLLCSFLYSSRTQAQNTVQGAVYDAQTRQPLPGVTVISPDSSVLAVTDARGTFEINSPYPLGFSFLGYQPQVVNDATDSQNLNLYLVPIDIPLQEVVVTGYENNRRLINTPGSIGLLNKRDLERFSNTSLVPAMNTIPGVRMEERSPASYRISIRGSTLRSPFGVRNVKIYWNDIPLTDPSGNTALNLIDFNTVGKIEVIKGPGGSLYGAGTGGVILLQSPNASYGEQNVEIGGLAGSFGLRGYNAIVRTAGPKENIVVTYSKLQSDGYRAHSAMDREVVNVRAQFFSSPKRTVAVNAFYNQLFYEIPGGLNLEEYQRDPRLARPRSAEQNSSIHMKTLNLGMSQTYQWNEHFSNTSSFYGTFTQFENPFITDYKRNTEQGFGGRTRFVYATDLGFAKSRFSLGGEFQRNFTAFRNYKNKGGKLDSLLLDDEITAAQGIVFSQMELDFEGDYFITLGASYNRLDYTIARLSSASVDPAYSTDRRFNPVFSPRLAALKKLTPTISVHGSISFGFSPPSIDDVRTSDGSINTDLEAEKGVNYEFGWRGSAFANRLGFDLTLFSLGLSNTITTYTNAQGVALFRNAGSTLQNGVETKVSWLLIDEPTTFISRAKVFANYAYNDFTFSDYTSNNNDLSGNRLTGTARNTASAGIDAETKNGLYTNITFNYVDRTPLNDANTVYADAYSLLGGRLGIRRKLGKLFINAYVGVDNALDQTYSLGNDLNAFGGRYYQPSAGINYYGGASVTYAFHPKKS